MKTQAIIFDIDGTAIDSPSQKTPSERLIKAVREVEKNYFVCAATGRPWSFAQPVLHDLNLVDPCIISGGTQICNPVSGEVLWQSNIEIINIEAIFSAVRVYPDLKVLYNDFDEEMYLSGGLKASDVQINDHVYFIDFIFVPEAIAPKIVAALSEIARITVTLAVAQRSGFNDIHITNRNTTKEHAVAELLKMIDVDYENTIGIGDGQNDVHLFNGVSHKVAMANAVAELKDISDEIIGSVGDDGLAAYLETLT